MPSISTLLKDLTVRLETAQPVVWIKTDEPSRAATVLRDTILRYILPLEAGRIKANQKLPEAQQNDLARNVFEHDLVNGCWQLTRDGQEIVSTKGTSPVYGEPVEWFNRDANGVPIQGQPKHNFRPDAPWRFIADMLGETPVGSIVLCHNLAEIVDMALRSTQVHAAAMMRNALFGLTGNLSKSSPVSDFKTTSRMLIATGRLPDSLIARPEILDTFDILVMDRPSESEIAELIQSLLVGADKEQIATIRKKNQAAYNTDDPTVQIERAALNLKGLTSFAAETATIRTIAESRHLAPALLTHQRKFIVEQNKGLTLEEPNPEFQMDRVKGMENLALFIKRAFNNQMPERLRVNAITLVGVPGSGKTMVARAIAADLGLPMIVCNLGKVFSSYIGSSQEGMTRLLTTLDAFAPAVVLFDEVDKQTDGLISDGGSRGDGGVGSQVMSMLLTWQQDRTSRPGPKVFVINTANRMANLKAETQRAGRNDATFFVDFPNRDVRKELVELFLSDYELTLTPDEQEKLVDDTHMYSGAEIKEIIKNLGRFGELESAFGFVRPVSTMSADDVTRMRDGAKNTCIPVTYRSIDEDGVASLSAASDRALRPNQPTNRIGFLLRHSADKDAPPASAA